MFSGLILSALKSLIPEKNVVCGYVAGAAIVAIVHGLGVLNVTLTPDQNAALGASTVVVVAHVWDTVAKFIAAVRAAQPASM